MPTSSLSIAACFPFRRAKVSAQSFSAEALMALIDIQPDLRFTTVCHHCGWPALRVHSRRFWMDWKTVKAIDKAFLEDQYGRTDYDGLRVLAVVEIAVKKDQRYMTVGIYYETGRVVWMGQRRSKETLAEFFAEMREAHVLPSAGR